MIIPENLINQTGESLSAFAGRLTGEALKLQREIDRLRSAIVEHREAQTASAHRPGNEHDMLLWRVLGSS
jgi:hypothetical protein